MPHNPSKIIRRFNFLGDYIHYWSGTIVSLDGRPFKILQVRQKRGDVTPVDYDGIEVVGKVLRESGGWSPPVVSGADSLCYDFPRLGFVKTTEGWYFMYRNPQRKMVKGYCNATIGGYNVSSPGFPPKLDVMKESVVRQLFYGNTDRISPNCIIDGDRRVWYEIEHVANILDNGHIVINDNHEKMGAYVCKLLGNSSVAASMVPNLVLPT